MPRFIITQLLAALAGFLTVRLIVALYPGYDVYIVSIGLGLLLVINAAIIRLSRKAKG